MGGQKRRPALLPVTPRSTRRGGRRLPTESGLDRQSGSHRREQLCCVHCGTFGRPRGHSGRIALGVPGTKLLDTGQALADPYASPVYENRAPRMDADGSG
ncbi:MAG: hypothetical protein DLM60_12015 [Pseudonocardiales bacterium]|nr:MAG: hypothetical protein DLM60_12015 [Pseudonocardiales bacterium]